MSQLDDAGDALTRRELPAFLKAIDEAERALTDLEQGRRDWETKAPPSYPPPAKHQERYFERADGAARAAPPDPAASPGKPRSSHQLRVLWSDVQDRLRDHASRDLREVVPLCLAAGRNPALRPSTRGIVRQMLEEHRELGDAVAAVRLEAMLTPPVRREFVVVCAAFEGHRKLEESELFALVLGDQEEAMALRESHRSSEDIARQLRTSRPPQPVLEPTPPTSALQKLLGVFRGKR